MSNTYKSAYMHVCTYAYIMVSIIILVESRECILRTLLAMHISMHSTSVLL